MSPARARAVPRQAGAIPVRRKGRTVEVCLVRRHGSKKWGIPKGFVAFGDTHEETALKETLEEAGLEGRAVRPALGIYEYEKWGETRLTVRVYLMDVIEELDVWDEMGRRERRWMAFDAAAERLARHPALPLLRRARARLARPQPERRSKTRARRRRT